MLCRLNEDCKHAQGKKTTRVGEHVMRAAPLRHPLTQPPPMSGTYLLLKRAAPPLRKDAPLPPRLGQPPRKTKASGSAAGRHPGGENKKPGVSALAVTFTGGRTGDGGGG